MVLTILQLWIRISFGLIAVAHFASHKLNTLLLVVLNFLYITTTVFLAIILTRHISIQASFYNDLAQLAETTDIPSAGRLISRSTSSLATVLALLAEIGTFLGTIAYLNISYAKNKSVGNEIRT